MKLLSTVVLMSQLSYINFQKRKMKYDRFKSPCSQEVVVQ